MKSKYEKSPVEAGGNVGGGGGPFRLPTQKVGLPRNQKGLVEIWSKRNNAKVSEARTDSGARKAVDRWDNKYGGYDHYIKRKYD